MRSEVTYFDIAMKEYCTLDSLFNAAVETDWYNILAQTCVQVIEKLMKDILQLSAAKEKIPECLFGTHQLNHLCRTVNSLYPNTVKKEKCAWLGNYYFEVRYPGENFIFVTQKEAEELISTTKELAQPLIDLHNSLTREPTNFFGGN